MEMKRVSYCYFTCNMVKLNGEKWVRESFDSIKNQSDDILVVGLYPRSNNF